MKTTSTSTCQHRVLTVNRKALVKLPKKTGDIETWLVSMGGKPITAKMQKKLADTGNWGMPKE
jgi:hypothetical protein